MLCRECLRDLVTRLVLTDIEILDALKGSSPLFGVTVEELASHTDWKGLTRLNRELAKLEFAGLIAVTMEGKKYKYYITESGNDLLGII